MDHRTDAERARVEIVIQMVQDLVDEMIADRDLSFEEASALADAITRIESRLAAALREARLGTAP
jgi:polyhydroxyalkanoate synthesis regulator phasin